MCNIVNNYELFIFDLDDTLVETEKYHYESWLHVLKEYIGTNFSMDYTYFIHKFHSVKYDAIKNYLFDELGIKDYDNIINEKNMYFLNLIKTKHIKLINGVQDFLDLIILHNKKFVIVTNGIKNNLEYFLELFPILKKSSYNYYRERFIKKKPDPECYLQVIKDFPNMKMIGFEDSITGIHAMSQVHCIDTVFINNTQYYYYNYIKETYKLKYVITDYNDLYMVNV
jgi:HAD superfamily hydrolase (TIGR01509 family)